MFTETSGSMYEEIENARKKKLRKRHVMKRRIIAIIILVLIVLYLGILLIDIARFHKGDKPLITLGQSVKEYDDGKVETYTSIGWVFRYYTRETINTTEIAPIWAPIRMDNVLNRVVRDQDLPELETNYSIPDNISKREKVDGVLFFYDKDENLLGTYKCILSETDCSRSSSAILDEDGTNRTFGTPMAIIENRYVFITEYKNANSDAEEKHVYLYDISAKHLIASYQDIRYSKTITDKNDKTYGSIDNSKYIVKKNDLWGIDEVIKGQVSNFEEYKYQYINFDEDTNLYIFETPKDSWGVSKWIAFDANKKLYTEPISEIIDSFYYKNDRIYIIAYTKNESTYKKNYLLYNQEGKNVLSKDDIDDLKAYDKFLIYTKDKVLYVIDYEGNELISSVKLYFEPTQSRVKQYTIRIIGNTLIITTPKSEDKTHLVDEYHYNMDDWSLIKTRNNVKETTE